MKIRRIISFVKELIKFVNAEIIELKYKLRGDKNKIGPFFNKIFLMSYGRLSDYVVINFEICDFYFNIFSYCRTLKKCSYVIYLRNSRQNVKLNLN